MYGICAAIKTSKLDETIEFYTSGIGYSEHKRLNPTNEISLVFLVDDRNGLLELIYSKNNEINNELTSSNVSIVIEVENLLESLARLENIGYKPLGKPIKVPSGEYIAFVKDPNGVEVELIENFIF